MQAFSIHSLVEIWHFIRFALILYRNSILDSFNYIKERDYEVFD